jgi:hypothetical protein
VCVELDHPLGQTVRVLDDAAPGQVLVELRVDRNLRVLPGLEVLALEWLLLQDPRHRFTPDRPPLPGQDHPGLGLLRQTLGWLLELCEALELDGVYLRPSYYHVGVKVHEVGRFLDPAAEASFRALERALGPLGLRAASAAFGQRRVIDSATSTAVEWDPAVMVLPSSRRLRDLVLGDEYERKVAAGTAGRAFHLQSEGQPSRPA